MTQLGQLLYHPPVFRHVSDISLKMSRIQQSLFMDLAPFMDHLAMCKDVLQLHDGIGISRQVKYWTGPADVDSPSIHKAYQQQILNYNNLGAELKAEMEQFPEEIKQGFSDSQTVMAETIKIKATRTLEELNGDIETAGELGFFFPGSPLWELQRKLRKEGAYSGHEAIMQTFSHTADNSSMVTSTSMNIYIGETASKPFSSTSSSASAHKLGESDVTDAGSSAAAVAADEDTTVTKFTNPLEEGGGSHEEEEVEQEPPPATKTVVKLDLKTVNRARGAQKRGKGGRKPKTSMVIQRKPFSTILEEGIDAWQELVPAQAWGMVNYDGQFISKAATRFSEETVVPHIDNTLLVLKVAIMFATQAIKLTTTVVQTVPFVKSVGYPLMLWTREGFKIYLADAWNVIEMITLFFFLLSFGFKAKMIYIASTSLEDQVELHRAGDLEKLDLEEFSWYSAAYYHVMAPQAFFMLIKVLKYFEAVPQLGLLVDVIADAIVPVLIFGIVAIIPVVGLALAFHVSYGQVLLNYSTVGKSINTLLRMSLGDFDFDEIFYAGNQYQYTAVVLFWISSLIVAFMLVNIFVAIILNSYDVVVALNPAANDSASFISTVIMQVKRTLGRSISTVENLGGGKDSTVEPHVTAASLEMERIKDEVFWNVMEGYFTLGGHGVLQMKREQEEKDREQQLRNSKAAGAGGAGGSSSSARASAVAIGAMQADIEVLKKSMSQQQKVQNEILDVLKALKREVTRGHE